MAGQGKGFVRKEKFNELRRRMEALESQVKDLTDKFSEMAVAEEAAAVIEDEVQTVEPTPEVEPVKEYTYEELIEILDSMGVEYDKRIKNVDKLRAILEESNG